MKCLLLQPLNKELYTLDPTFFFLPSFLEAIKENTEESFRSIVSEPFPGVYVFKMLQPRFCEMMLSEVNNPIILHLLCSCLFAFVHVMLFDLSGRKFQKVG